MKSLPRNHPARSRRPALIPLLLLLALVLCLSTWRARWQTAAPRESKEAQVQQFLALEQSERNVEETVWAAELEAERHEDVFLALWEALNHSRDPLITSVAFAFGQLRIGSTNSLEQLQHGIIRLTFSNAANLSAASVFTPEQWRAKLKLWRADGWRLGRTSWHETQFSPETSNRSAVSIIDLSAQLTNDVTSARATLRGELHVTWKSVENSRINPTPDVITLQKLELLTRNGPPAFTEIFTADLTPSPGSSFADPLLVQDLDGDGLSEIVLVGANKIFRNDSGRFRAEPLAALPRGRIYAALLIDLTADGRADLLIAGADGLWVFENDGRGHFPATPRLLWRAPGTLLHPQVISAGDIDGDGDLDLWLAQYKLPYPGGQFPTPYYDASDGFPAFLLRNDGREKFSDVTAEAGLRSKRSRRTYSASFVDLDNDGDLDLVNVSDFAGVDLWINDGRGHFTDATAPLGETRHLFGMAHALADLNGDERVDLLAIGMDSPVAARLSALGSIRPGFSEHAAKLAPMTFGNRLFLGTSSALQLAPFAEQLAHAGWAWGVSFFDIDNDGDLDVAIANGHETLPSVKDYERQFWLHDIYVGTSQNNPVTDLYFNSARGRRLAEQASFGGWQNNVLFINSSQGQFADVAFLLGLAEPEDSHNLVSDDVDGDGRLDLIVRTFGTWPERQQHLRIFRNQISDSGNWLGVRLDSTKRAWTGARVRLQTPLGSQTRWLVTGDSYRSQHAPAPHFGLGRGNIIAKLEIVWADGSHTAVRTPELNRWNKVSDDVRDD